MIFTAKCGRKSWPKATAPNLQPPQPPTMPKGGQCSMNIIAEAKARENKIHSNADLLSSQREMLETMLTHHAISEAEYLKSLEALLKHFHQK